MCDKMGCKMQNHHCGPLKIIKEHPFKYFEWKAVNSTMIELSKDKQMGSHGDQAVITVCRQSPHICL